jgi:hypothetical protein
MEYRRGQEIRADGRKLAGYAAKFDREARIQDFTETITRGAFGASLAQNDVLALVDHSPEKLLARTSSGTLRLQEDREGLAFELDLPETQLGKDVLALAERGDLGGMSFGFYPVDESWEGRRRELRQVDLLEVSVVHSWPAYDGTEVQARAGTPRLCRLRRYLETIP